MPHPENIRKNVWPAWFLLFMGFLLTAAATVYKKAEVEADTRRALNFACSQTQLRIHGRMRDHAQILLDAAALFDASDGVTREKWHAFTMKQKIGKNLPGVQGIGFSLLIPRDQIARHIQEIRSQGFPDYHVWPEGDREIYTSVIWLEPFSGRNILAFGYDMFTETVRWAAMERAMDMDEPALSGKVNPVAETGQDIQTGTLMFVPVYRKGMPTDTVADRHEALCGWVYSPYRMKDLMQGILGGWDFEAEKRIRLQIFDDRLETDESLLYDSQSQGEAETPSASRLTTLEMPMDLNGRVWYLRLTQTCGQPIYSPVYGVFFVGTSICLLLFGLILSLLNTRFRVWHLADQLTVDIRESEDKLHKVMQVQQIILDTANIGISLVIDRKQVWVNRKMSDMIRYPKGELEGQITRKFYPSQEAYEQLGRDAYPVLAQGRVFVSNQKLIRKDGTPIWTRYNGKAIDPSDMSKGTIWLLEDITERREWEWQHHQLRKAESLKRMAGAVAHHFNNQLQVVMGNLEMVMENLASEVGIRKPMAHALIASHRAADLSRRMLVYLGEISGKQSLMDLSNLCRESLILIQADAPEGLAINTDLPSSGPIICANADQMQQVLSNLVTNAWESLNDIQSAIQLTVSTVLPADISQSHRFPIDWQPQDTLYACLEVTDTGCGISDNDIGKIFDPFFSSKFTGRGMGLSAAMGIIRAHGGGITVASERGQGSTFQVYLPVSSDEVAALSEKQE